MEEINQHVSYLKSHGFTVIENFLNTKETKSKADQFDDLFNEDDKDDLPF